MPNLPQPNTIELANSNRLIEIICSRIEQGNGFLSFPDFLNIVLYFPQLGYYSGAVEKIGSQGDFVTAPNLNPIFAKTLAIQLQEILQQTEKNIYEFGAGTGHLAADLLSVLPSELVENYYIIDISNNLTERQLATIREKAPQQFAKIKHLDRLPTEFNGVIIGNEVLDAMPCELIEQNKQQLLQVGVTVKQQNLGFIKRPLTDSHRIAEARKYLPQTEYPYQTELHLQQKAFIATLCERMQRAAAIFIDYGFDAQQYYHPQRSNGTLIGHYKHYTIQNPFFYPGLVDLTCHISFSAIAESIVENNADLIGYCNQANFLINLGITELLQQIPDTTSSEYLKAVQACQLLINQHEMGELFKVIAFAKNINPDWKGFRTGDLTFKL